MRGNTITPAQEREALDYLRDRGVAKVVLHFSGGNDEGGVDSVSAFDTEGNKVDLPEGHAHQDWQSKEWVIFAGYDKNHRPVRRPATVDEIAIAETESVLAAPIYDRYYTFAGEFYVDGTLTWDVAAGTHKMSGQESHEVWEEFEV